VLHQLGEAFESVCCIFPDRLDEPLIRPQPANEDQLLQQHMQLQAQTGYFASGRQPGGAATSSKAFPRLLRIAGLSPQTVASTIDLGAATARITARDPIVTSLLVREDLQLVGGKLGAQAMASAFEQPAAQEALKEFSADAVARVEERIGRLKVDAMRIAEEAQKEVDERLREVEDDIGKRVTTSGLAQTRVIRDLREQLEAQQAETKALNQRLAKLERGTKS
jgi:hypothetical protein